MNRNRHGSIPHGTYSLVGQAENNKCQTQNTKKCSQLRAGIQGLIEHGTEELDLDWGHSSQGLENEIEDGRFFPDRRNSMCRGHKA